jgi:hypothetical protein
VARRLRIDAQIFLALLALIVLFWRAGSPFVFPKDLQEDYLAAVALRHGSDLLRPLSDLEITYLPEQAAVYVLYPHPSPHLPVLAVLDLPLTLLPYPAVVVLWLTLNVGLLLWIGRSLGLSPVASLALAAWPPVFMVLDYGQWELVVLGLILLAWRQARAGRDRRAGILLGVAGVIKIYPLVLLLPYVARRRWGVVAFSALVVSIAEAGNLALLGPGGFLDYHLRVLPSVTGYYSMMALNSSPHGALLRLFGGAVDVPPVVNAPGVVLPLTTALSILALVALCRLPPESGVAALLVALPNVWGSYATLALPLLVTLWRSAISRLALVLVLIATSFVLVFFMAWTPFAALISSLGPREPAVLALLGAVQPVGLIALLVLSWNVEQGDEWAATGAQPANIAAVGASHLG